MKHNKEGTVGSLFCVNRVDEAIGKSGRARKIVEILFYGFEKIGYIYSIKLKYMEKISFEEFKKLALELDMQYNEDYSDEELERIKERFDGFTTLDEILSYFSEGGLDNEECYPILLGLLVNLPE